MLTTLPSDLHCLYSEIIGYFLFCHFAEERKCNSLVLITFFVTAIIYPGEEGVGKNCARCLQYKTRVVLQTKGTVFFL